MMLLPSLKPGLLIIFLMLEVFVTDISIQSELALIYPSIKLISLVVNENIGLCILWLQK